MEKKHDLHTFMNQISNEISSEYDRIQVRAKEDPGTAGDQGEENWATILKDWLPGNYHIVTKGRIINEKGEGSPQIDILVLHEFYPKKLLDKKVYLAAGVAAAFECKTTLNASHILESIENSIKIKSLYPERQGTPYKELHSPIIYGLLAHSHSWKGEKSQPTDNIERKLLEEYQLKVKHPKLSLDFICVADLGFWNFVINTFIGPKNFPGNWEVMAPFYGDNGSASTSYIGSTINYEHQDKSFKPIGALISNLAHKLSWENIPLRSLSNYYRLTGLDGAGAGKRMHWSTQIYSPTVRSKLENGHILLKYDWDEWSGVFF